MIRACFPLGFERFSGLRKWAISEETQGIHIIVLWEKDGQVEYCVIVSFQMLSWCGERKLQLDFLRSESRGQCISFQVVWGAFELYKLIAIQWRGPEKNIEFNYTKLNQGNMSCILAFMDLNWQLLCKKDFETHEKTD